MSVTTSPSFLAQASPDIALLPTMSECTVAQAAKVLDMSEGCVIGLLNDKIIVSRQENGERWIQWDSLMKFEEDYREGLKVLSEITQDWQEMGLYD